ncbi:hypothetical protein C942_04912 [Photobacterium marinum]|uniref:Uncharacterized protein n=1 Tax=Photobacterium marinum TaxID=1056511 RepID=L8JBR0_9GAMM|nr:hypothetical protein C942_04912 [Photobacterium marinum]
MKQADEKVATKIMVAAFFFPANLQKVCLKGIYFITELLSQ